MVRVTSWSSTTSHRQSRSGERPDTAFESCTPSHLHRPGKPVLLVIAGVLMALRRRLRDHGAAALQDFQEDLLPLFLLFAVSVTGLMLTASYTWMKGYAYEFLAILHAITVIFTLLWLPFGKFFHIFQRPAQLGVKF